jgi:hypothetical protein
MQTMNVAQRGVMQPRVTLRTQFGSCNAVRMVRGGMRVYRPTLGGVRGMQPHFHVPGLPPSAFLSPHLTKFPPTLSFQTAPVLAAARPAARPQMAVGVVAAAATAADEAQAVLRFQRGSPMKVRHSLDGIPWTGGVQEAGFGGVAASRPAPMPALVASTAIFSINNAVHHS